MPLSSFSSFFFFNDTATTEIYTLSLHDALPISTIQTAVPDQLRGRVMSVYTTVFSADRKSTRLNSSHLGISYAVFCLKKKKNLTVRRRSGSPPRSHKNLMSQVGYRHGQSAQTSE